MQVCYRPQTKLRKSNAFTPVCDSVSEHALGRWVCIPACTGQEGICLCSQEGWGVSARHTPRQIPLSRTPRQKPPRQTPPGSHFTPARHPPRQPLQRTVRILLECILVVNFILFPFFGHFWICIQVTSIVSFS